MREQNLSITPLAQRVHNPHPDPQKRSEHKKQSNYDSDMSKLDSINSNKYHFINSKSTQNDKIMRSRAEKLFEKSNKQNRNYLSMALVNSKNIYINFNSPKTQPEISRMSFPYFLQEEVQSPPKKAEPITKISNRVFTKNKEQKQPSNYNFKKVSNQQPPVNQFLCYNLSKEINNGLFQVKVLAEEIKKIKKQKQELLEDKNKYKPNNKIKISGGNRSIGLWRQDKTKIQNTKVR